MSVRKAVLWVVNTGMSMDLSPRFQPHALLPLGRKTVLQVLLDEFAEANAEEVIVAVGPGDGQVCDVIEALGEDGLRSVRDGKDTPAARMSFTFECLGPEATGSPGAVLLAVRSLVGYEPFMFAGTDTPIYQPSPGYSLLARMSEVLELTRGDGAIAVCPSRASSLPDGTGVKPIGGMTASPHFVVSGFVRHPSAEGGCRHMCLAPRYVLSPIIFDYLSEEAELSGREDFLAALGRLALDREALWAVRMHDQEQCFYLSSLLLYSRAFISFSLHDAEIGVAVREYIDAIAR